MKGKATLSYLLIFFYILLLSGKKKSTKKLKETMLQKKTRDSAIKAALSPCGCENQCKRKEFVTASFIKKQRKSLWRRNGSERDQWLLDKLEEFSQVGKQGCHFHLCGDRICRNAWFQVFGINKNTYYRVMKKWKKGAVTVSRGEGRTFSLDRMQSAAWFSKYLATNGENPPHVSEIWLPYRTRKKDVYDEYKDDMVNQNLAFCSYQTFLNMWNQCFRNVKSRKVSILL